MLKLLLIDDEYYFRQSLKKLINYSEHDFQFAGEANNGKTGFQMILEKKPDVVLVDINMPIMSGLELIEKCHKNSIDCEFIVLTGYAEFEYAQKAIKFNVSNYILKPINKNELINSLEKIKNKIYIKKNEIMKLNNALSQNKFLKKELILNRIIKGNYFNSAKSADSYKLSEYISTCHDNYTAALISCTAQVECEKLEQLGMDGILLTAFYTDDKHICIIFNYPDNADVSNIINTIYRYLLTAYNVKITISVGCEYKSISKIVLSYNEALMAIRSDCDEKDNIAFYNMLNEKYTNDLFPEAIKNKIISSIAECDKNSTKNYLKEIFNKCREKNICYNTFALVAINLINIIFDITFKYSMEKFMNIHNEIINLIIAKKDIFIIENKIINVCLIIIDHIPKIHYSSIVKQAINYISNEYKNPNLNIKLLSDELHVNYGYLCSCFKNAMNITLNNYITNTRLEKATQYFNNGMINISMVAYNVGYQDVSYFSRSFKKKYGVSPINYIKQI